MKYLVNRETKEHRPMPEGYMDNAGGHIWRIVEADAEGWIKWEDGECPLPDNSCCEVRGRVKADKYVGASRNVIWSCVKSYRPILDKPEVRVTHTWVGEPDNQKPEYVGSVRMTPPSSGSVGIMIGDSVPDLLTRLKSAHEAAQSIPDLLSELREQLAPIGIGVMYLSEFNAIEPEPEPDMTDWRNWRAGDEVRCLDSFGWGGRFLRGRLYKVERLARNGVVIAGQNIGRHVNDFRFHSRPPK